MMQARWICTAMTMLLLFFSSMAMAQGTRGVPVTERPRPDYDALGVRAGGFLVKPELKLGLEYNDNIFATKSNKESDFITIIAPKVDVRSTWSRHALGLSAGIKGGVYASNSDENFLDAHLLLDGRLDVVRDSYLQARLGTQRLHEERGDPDSQFAFKDPVVYYRSMAEALYHHGFGRMSLRGGGGITNYDYKSVDLRDGGSRNLDIRDRNIYNLNARLAYELLPNVQPFLTGRYDWRRYDKSEARRDSDGYRIGVGTGFDLGGITTGEIFGGYMHQDYKDAGRENISAPWYGLSLLWNVTQLTSIQGSVEKSVKETTLDGASGIDAVDTSLRVDHELLRNLLLGAFFDFTHDDYEGRDITDKYYTFGPRVTYLWNRNLSAGLEYAYRNKDSNLTSREYTENRFTISLTGRF